MPPGQEQEFVTDLEPLHPGDNYRRLVESMPVMLWTANAEGQWDHVNRLWVEYTGVVRETRGFGFEEALHPDDEARTVAVWSAAVARRENYEIEYRLRGKEGGYRWFLVRGVHVSDEGGRGIAWVGTCTDIEEQKRARLEALAARESAVRALGLALETRDGESGGHTDRVTDLALRLGRALDLDEGSVEALRVGAYLHDVGKLSVPDAILLKPGPLDEAEWEVMRRHVLEGERFAATLGFVPPAALKLIRDHHERWDGSGYPGGLAGEAIPLLARLFAVVDVYDALCSERPYKPAWPEERVLAALRDAAGRQLDPQMVATFLGLLGQNGD